MTASKKRRAVEEPRITAQPTASRRRMRKRAVPESGLSVDPDDLGREFLSDATEQNNFEGEPDQQLSLGAAPSDEALSSEESDGSVWDQTMRRAPTSDIREISDPALHDDDEAPEEEEGRPTPVDVHQTRIVGASLFDEESDEPGEVRSPEVDADES